MKRKGMTLIEIVVIIVIVGVLSAILYPVLRPRFARFYTAIVPPQHFKSAELQTVVAQLDKALQVSRAEQGKKPVPYLKVSWQTESLKSRLVSFDTQQPLPLKEVLARLEKTAHIKIDYGGWCGTCGGPMGKGTISDTLKATNKQQNKMLHPTA